ncbi:histone-lysine N-methyltransferase, H3 lysine-9 specific SUVH1-like [Lolium rigidum]|uniref:histone-lysine N-methyltransferase, H3 lysine-9 specific SUVH1-like n=1 Tax=Lolium rigidum TaxID=89674 RepID=UPI001F5CC8D0|nr:histone-lysine N-methyltransferase, H3 lysine-9 specific SUVH1-like [Lolium rigidum]XP_047095340.1 histone-lysine N-methyltransferase, H3 lysine-9 specific SUVH1-like [Lolium rigidum]
MDRARNFIPDPNEELLDIKPLRSLAPMFPAPMGVNIIQSSTPPLVCVTPVGQFPTGFGAGNLPAFGSFATFSATANGFSHAGTSANGPTDATPISAYKTRSSGGTSEHKAKRSSGLAADGSNGVKAKRLRPNYKNLVAGKEIAFLPASNSNPRDTVEAVHMIFEALRRRHVQMDETQDGRKCANMKAGTIMIANNIRANAGKKVGPVPGVEIGDIFYFRMELCIIGLHAQSMCGIDYIGNVEDSVAICIVAAGGYENQDDDTETLVYSGSGGNSKNTEERHDQKLERGNLALERSVHRKNEIRVVRGFKDPACVSGKIYIYDGLYKIQESWKERTKFGINCFKYRLQREPGQPDGAAIWKMTQRWIQDPSTRGTVILPDLSSGAEIIPVCLVNEVDHEKGLGHFTYTNEVKYLRSLTSVRPLLGCQCESVCLPGDTSCACGQHNGGDLPYNSSGVLVFRKPVIYECGEACHCTLNCRNRVTQKENRYHFEVFRTTNRGWGLRCWDPIRAGAFICEYTGDVVDGLNNLDDYIFQTACPGDKTLKWNCGSELLGEESTYVSADEFEPLPIKISAKRRGNVSRFMNHSCSPNVFWQPVQYDHGDDKHPHIMFFALNHIPPMTELTYDYGVVGAEPTRRTRNCLCGSSSCRGVF